MNRSRWRSATVIALLLTFTASVSAQEIRRITILYDAFVPSSQLEKDWTYAAFVEYGGKRILFDTGNNAKIFEHNTRHLGIDLTRLDAVVISHRHGDHTSGLAHLLEVNSWVRIYAPQEGAFFKSRAPLCFSIGSGNVSIVPDLAPSSRYRNVRPISMPPLSGHRPA